MRIVRMQDCPGVPWKNGQGTTREILRHPEGSVAFDWRLSVADVVQSGPFSEFPGYQRVITLLEGDGFVLRFADGREHPLTAPHVPYPFDGGAALSCMLPGGSSKDLNLMLRRDAARADFEVADIIGEGAIAPASAATRLIFCLTQGLRLRSGKAPAVDLGRWDTAMFDPAETQEHDLHYTAAGPAKVFHVLISEVAGPQTP